MPNIISQTTKEDKTYDNVELNKLLDGESTEIILLRDKPWNGKGKFGDFHSFKVLCEGKECGMILGERYRSGEYGKMLWEVLKNYKTGDKLRITRQKRESKGEGRPYTLYESDYLGTVEDIQKARGTQAKETAIEQGIELSDIEKAIVEHPQIKGKGLAYADLIQVFEDNKIPTERARRIYEKHIRHS